MGELSPGFALRNPQDYDPPDGLSICSFANGQLWFTVDNAVSNDSLVLVSIFVLPSDESAAHFSREAPRAWADRTVGEFRDGLAQEIAESWRRDGGLVESSMCSLETSECGAWMALDNVWVDAQLTSSLPLPISEAQLETESELMIELGRALAAVVHDGE